MIHTLVSRYPMTLTKSQLATQSKLLPQSGMYGTYLSMLELRGFIQVKGNEVSITKAGLELDEAQTQEPQTQEQIIALWRENLPEGAKRMLDLLVSIYPAAVTRLDLGAAVQMSPTSGTFSTYLGTLKRNGLLELTSEKVKASQNLFIDTYNRSA